MKHVPVTPKTGHEDLTTLPQGGVGKLVSLVTLHIFGDHKQAEECAAEMAKNPTAYTVRAATQFLGSEKFDRYAIEFFKNLPSPLAEKILDEIISDSSNQKKSRLALELLAQRNTQTAYLSITEQVPRLDGERIASIIPHLQPAESTQIPALFDLVDSVFSHHGERLGQLAIDQVVLSRFDHMESYAEAIAEKLHSQGTLPPTYGRAFNKLASMVQHYVPPSLADLALTVAQDHTNHDQQTVDNAFSLLGKSELRLPSDLIAYAMSSAPLSDAARSWIARRVSPETLPDELARTLAESFLAKTPIKGFERCAEACVKLGSRCIDSPQTALRWMQSSEHTAQHQGLEYLFSEATTPEDRLLALKVILEKQPKMSHFLYRNIFQALYEMDSSHAVTSALKKILETNDSIDTIRIGANSFLQEKIEKSEIDAHTARDFIIENEISIHTHDAYDNHWSWLCMAEHVLESQELNAPVLLPSRIKGDPTLLLKRGFAFGALYSDDLNFIEATLPPDCSERSSNSSTVFVDSLNRPLARIGLIKIDGSNQFVLEAFPYDAEECSAIGSEASKLAAAWLNETTQASDDSRLMELRHRHEGGEPLDPKKKKELDPANIKQAREERDSQLTSSHSWFRRFLERVNRYEYDRSQKHDRGISR